MAYRLASFAAEAYQSRPVLKAKYGRKFYAFINGESQGRFGLRIADTQAFILKYKKGRDTHAMVAFRGTESLFKVPADWLTNLDKSQAIADWLTIPGEEQPHMHRGFLRAYAIIRPELIDAAKEIQPQHIYLTGHSLGGNSPPFMSLCIVSAARGSVNPYLPECTTTWSPIAIGLYMMVTGRRNSYMKTSSISAINIHSNAIPIVNIRTISVNIIWTNWTGNWTKQETGDHSNYIIMVLLPLFYRKRK
jgi:hypothetical protein